MDDHELLRLRNEVGQLRRERDALKQRAGQPAAGAGQGASKPGQYISKEQLAFVGYATPEAAMESMTWALMKGTYDRTITCLAPEMLKDEGKGSKFGIDRQQFETEREGRAAAFEGMQIVARKTLDGDRAELKLRLGGGPSMPGIGDEPPFLIETMVKVGNEWKMGDREQAYQPEWDNTGQIQSFAQ